MISIPSARYNLEEENVFYLKQMQQELRNYNITKLERSIRKNDLDIQSISRS